MYFICSMAKLEVTSESPARCLPGVYKNHRSSSYPPPGPAAGGHTPRHTPETENLRHLRDFADEAAIPVATVMLSLNQHKRRQPKPDLFRIQQRDAPTQNTFIFQPLQALPTGRGGQINGIGQRLQREGCSRFAVKKATYGQFYLT